MEKRNKKKGFLKAKTGLVLSVVMLSASLVFCGCDGNDIKDPGKIVETEKTLQEVKAEFNNELQQKIASLGNNAEDFGYNFCNDGIFGVAKVDDEFVVYQIDGKNLSYNSKDDVVTLIENIDSFKEYASLNMSESNVQTYGDFEYDFNAFNAESTVFAKAVGAEQSDVLKVEINKESGFAKIYAFGNNKFSESTFELDKSLSGDALIADFLGKTPTVIELELNKNFENITATSAEETLQKMQSNFEEFVGSKIAGLFENAVFFENYGYEISADKLVGFAKVDNDLVEYGFDILQNSSLQTKQGIANLMEDAKGFAVENKFDLCEINDLVFDGFRFNLGAIKGKNVFAEKLGVSCDDSITVVRFATENNKDKLSVFVFANNQLAKAEVLQDSAKNIDLLEAIDQRSLVETLLQKLPQASTVGAEIAIDIFMSATAPVLELDTFALENKIMQAYNEFGEGIKIVSILFAYSVDGDKLNVLMKQLNGGVLYPQFAVYQHDIPSNSDISTQKGIDKLTKYIAKENVIDIIRPLANHPILMNMQKEDIVLNDGRVFDCNGIDGDNVWADECNLDGTTIQTYLGYMHADSYDTNFPSCYSHVMYIVNIYYNENKDVIVRHNRYHVSGTNNGSIIDAYDNFFITGRSEKQNIEETTFNMGKDVKFVDKTVEEMTAQQDEYRYTTEKENVK